MEILDSKVMTYQIIPIGTNIAGWGAKGKIYTAEGIIETDEVLGNTEEEVEQNAKIALELLKKTLALQD